MLGAGDQGHDVRLRAETDELMPVPIAVAHRLSRRLSDVRKAGDPVPGPTARGQVSVRYVMGDPRASTRSYQRAALGGGRRRDVAAPDVEAERPTPCCEFPSRASEGGTREPHRPLRDRRPEGGHRLTGRKTWIPWGQARTAAARSAARTPRRSTGRRAHDALRREERRGRRPRRSLPAAGRVRDRQRPIPCPSWSIRPGPNRSTRRSSRRRIWDIFDFWPAATSGTRPPPADLPRDRGVRASQGVPVEARSPCPRPAAPEAPPARSHLHRPHPRARPALHLRAPPGRRGPHRPFGPRTQAHEGLRWAVRMTFPPGSHPWSEDSANCLRRRRPARWRAG